MISRYLPQNRQPWLMSSSTDLLFVLSPPFLVALAVVFFPKVFANGEEVGMYAWVALVLLVDVGHVYSTLYKTYFDPLEYAKRKSLYLMVPLACLVVGVVLYSLSDMLFWRAMAYMAVYHFVRQQYGFMRLYSRADNPSNLRFDTYLVYAATLYPMVYWHLQGPLEFHWFVDGDFIYLDGFSWANTLDTVLFYMYVALFLAYCYQEASVFIRHKTFNLPKNLVIVGTMVSWYVGIVLYNGDLVFTALNIISHGVPYVALIWIYGKKESTKSSDRYKGLLSVVFKQYGVVLFILIIIGLAYVEEGFWDAFVWRDHTEVFPMFNFLPRFTSPEALSLIVPLLSLPQLTHYVLDGFIWKRGTN